VVQRGRRKKREPMAKHQARQWSFTLICPLTPMLAPRFTVCDVFPLTVNSLCYGGAFILLLTTSTGLS
jgi:hypothetical protein